VFEVRPSSNTDEFARSVYGIRWRPHGTLGEGVVVRVEPGGVVTVRFADDGTERRLMLDYAPLEKL
jgi:hypothetical protein